MANFERKREKMANLDNEIEFGGLDSLQEEVALKNAQTNEKEPELPTNKQDIDIQRESSELLDDEKYQKYFRFIASFRR